MACAATSSQWQVPHSATHLQAAFILGGIRLLVGPQLGQLLLQAEEVEANGVARGELHSTRSVVCTLCEGWIQSNKHATATATPRTCSCVSWPLSVACASSSPLLSAASEASCCARPAACSLADSRSAAGQERRWTDTGLRLSAMR